MNIHRRCADLFDGADDLKIIAEPGRAAVVDVNMRRQNRRCRRRAASRLFDPDCADHVGTGTLHELQIIGVIDDASGVGVLEIDAECETMLLADEAAAVGSVEFGGGHRYRSSDRRLTRKPRSTPM